MSNPTGPYRTWMSAGQVPDNTRKEPAELPSAGEVVGSMIVTVILSVIVFAPGILPIMESDGNEALLAAGIGWCILVVIGLIVSFVNRKSIYR